MGNLQAGVRATPCLHAYACKLVHRPSPPNTQLLQHAVKSLLSLGADAREMWQPHAHDEIDREDDKS